MSKQEILLSAVILYSSLATAVVFVLAFRFKRIASYFGQIVLVSDAKDLAKLGIHGKSNAERFNIIRSLAHHGHRVATGRLVK